MFRFVLTLAFAGVVSIGAAGAPKPPATQPDVNVNIAAGKQLFQQHCAVCHGIHGNGDSSYESGTYLPPRQPPAADLTALSIDNGGVFPADRVRNAIQCSAPIAQHGTPEMPAWGNAFYDLKSRPKEYEKRVREITAFIESIQTTRASLR
jgi:mono/diheme cytochrome c family protein